LPASNTLAPNNLLELFMPARYSPLSIRTFVLLLCAVNGTLSVADEPSADRQAQLDFFEAKIRPVLVQHCYECHSADSKSVKGGLLLDTAAGLLTGGDSGPAIVPGRSTESVLIHALNYDSFQMPPTGRLPAAVVRDFEQWIEGGAVDPRTGPAAVVKKAMDFSTARQFWSFVVPQKPAVPEVRNAAWARSDVDRFVLAAMEQQGLSPSPAATRTELIRRATFDLLGLPPTPAEVDAFLADESPDAFAALVDRLLQSPHYGERWGRYWLDVARYSEDQAHTFAVSPNTSGWRYRDWVVSAFNRDLPYDQFVRYQIAADLVPMPEDQRLTELPALGYFGLGPQYYKNTDAAKAAADELDDRIDTLCRGFLGLTVSCARCHDHKFDPVPTQDYYSLAGIFSSSRLHTAPLVPQTEVEAYNHAQTRLKELDESIRKRIAESGPQVRQSQLPQVSAYLQAVWQLQAGGNPDMLAQAAGLNPRFLKRWQELLQKQKDTNPVFRNWASLAGPADQAAAGRIPAAVVAAAAELQQHLQLLLKQGQGALTAEETAELRKLVPAGNALWTSGIIRKAQPAAEIDLDLNGALELHLVVTNAGDGDSCDHADWAEARLVTAEGELRLSELKWRSVAATYGSVNLNRNVQGGRLKIGGREFGHGLGTHATSHIIYDLPQGVQRFRAVAGLDHSGTDQGGCGEAASVQFRVYTQTPTDLNLTQSDLLTQVFGEQGVFAVDLQQLEQLLPAQQQQELKASREELERLRKAHPAMYPVAHIIADGSPADMKVFVRGNPANQGDVAPRRFLKVLAGDQPPVYQQGSGRLQLAEDIASPQNPLFSRVMVNRIWQQHFGRGLVSTPDNFGSLGERPTHPELLDWLAVRFHELGWSVKAMHRELLLSAAWQQSSLQTDAGMAIDADNRYLWRMNRRRLDVESWRDALLAVSGRLDRQMGGPSTNLAEDSNSRRTVYAFVSRHELDNMLRLFDFPDANITASTRSETTVPQQQLFVINSPFMLNQAKAFAARLHSEAGADSGARIALAFRLAFGRGPTDDELQLGLAFVNAEDGAELRDGTSLNRWERYAQILLASNEFMYLD